MTTVRRVAHDLGVGAGTLHAAGLLSEAAQAVVGAYVRDVDPAAVDDALDALDASLGREEVDRVLGAYREAFGNGEQGGEALGGGPAGAAREDRQTALVGVLSTWLANANPAFRPIADLTDDGALRSTGTYDALISHLAAHFHERPPIGPDEQPLLTMLRSPAVEIPDSLSGQLEYVREHWGPLIGDLLDQLAIGSDVLGAEDLALWRRANRPVDGGVTGSAEVYEFGGFVDDRQGFTADRDWHPRVVLLARSVHVWLDGLSRRHGRDIRTLDAVPEEELARLASWGVTALWLVGIWQRSRASERIKRMRGSPDAAASAYALDDYAIADDLGGEGAWLALSERAGRHGIRLGADMVPNHMGIDSRWVVEHPEWFVSLPESPFPSYSFSGPDLSEDPRVAIALEDHYWDGTDAAVVFRREDRAAGDVRYIYHGNDGTSYPWNDTAQLDHLRADVREQLLRTIVAVARRFPVIRFDAAMVLTRRHVRRLWYPEAGQGSTAIPSRAERPMSQAAFDRAMPNEFWRDVVERIAVEAPETLLLAEAFWLLEGYFVRTLGMHRVYNSAFMHMLRDERNAEYRLVMRNTLEFDPEVLRRFVNFMTNPDEKPAIDTFGDGDKYLGAATLLATLPGLPLLGHGQVEGFHEKYGHEYRRAAFDEPVNEGLLAAHERWIFPLLRRRGQFAGTDDFLLYDVRTADGHVNEDVFAYSNIGPTGERSLVVFHNRYAETAGAIRLSVSYSVADAEVDGGRRLVRRSLAEGWRLPSDGGAWFVACRDAVSGLEHLHAATDLAEGGMPIALRAYERRVLLDVRDVLDEPDGRWAELCARLAGRGVPSLADELAVGQDLPAALDGIGPEARELVGEPPLHGLDRTLPEGAEPDITSR
ncbi:MAG TPA: alpha-amylase family glycosyl hydrolase [Candidatus Limnocylindrales bacterium]|nr:alpha-amylase family glycosyl hydrolase [Candidatus Limnocylindrales bacterium]